MKKWNECKWQMWEEKTELLLNAYGNLDNVQKKND